MQYSAGTAVILIMHRVKGTDMLHHRQRGDWPRIPVLITYSCNSCILAVPQFKSYAAINRKGKNKSKNHVPMQIPGVTPPCPISAGHVLWKRSHYVMKGATKDALWSNLAKPGYVPVIRKLRFPLASSGTLRMGLTSLQSPTIYWSYRSESCFGVKTFVKILISQVKLLQLLMHKPDFGPG